MLAALSLLAAACRDRAPLLPSAVAVRTETVEKGVDSAGTRYSAQITPAVRVDLAFKVGGYVESIAKTVDVDGKPRLVQDGDPVNAGVELASVRRTDYVQKLEQARASLGEARAAAEQAEIDFQRDSHLLAEKVIAQSVFDASRTRRDAALAAVAGARARLEEAQTALADTSLRSPLTGVIVKRMVEVGTLVSPGTVAYVLQDVSRVKVVLGVPDTALARVKLGAAQSITTEALPGVTFEGRISRIAPTADVKSRVFEVEVMLDNKDGRLRPGMVAALSLERAPGEAVARELLVPLSAVVRGPGGKGFGVFVVANQDGKLVAQARGVELGAYMGRFIPVIKGLTGGESVVTQGAGLLSDGARVEVVK